MFTQLQFSGELLSLFDNEDKTDNEDKMYAVEPGYVWDFSMWDTCLCGTVFIGTVKHLLLCTSPGYVGHMATWDSWDGPLSFPLFQVRQQFL